MLTLLTPPLAASLFPLYFQFSGAVVMSQPSFASHHYCYSVEYIPTACQSYLCRLPTCGFASLPASYCIPIFSLSSVRHGSWYTTATSDTLHFCHLFLSPTVTLMPYFSLYLFIFFFPSTSLFSPLLQPSLVTLRLFKSVSLTSYSLPSGVVFIISHITSQLPSLSTYQLSRIYHQAHQHLLLSRLSPYQHLPNSLVICMECSGVIPPGHLPFPSMGSSQHKRIPLITHTHPSLGQSPSLTPQSTLSKYRQFTGVPPVLIPDCYEFTGRALIPHSCHINPTPVQN